MKSWFLVPLLSAALTNLSRADDLSTRAAQAKSQMQTSWLPTWAATSPSNENAGDAARLLETLSHAHRLDYSTPQLNLLDAARVHYRLLRDSRRDKVGDGFFADSGGNQPLKETRLQAQVVSSLVEYARVSGEAEPRGLAIKIWRLIRDRGRDKTGGYFDSFLSGPLAPTQPSGSGLKSAATHLALLEAGTGLVNLTRDRSITRDLVELLDLNEGHFFPARIEDSFEDSADFNSREPRVFDANELSLRVESAAAIARARQALAMPIAWVDVARRSDALERTPLALVPVGALDALPFLAKNLPATRERRAAQFAHAMDSFGTLMPDTRSGRALLDFVAAFSTPSGE